MYAGVRTLHGHELNVLHMKHQQSPAKSTIYWYSDGLLLSLDKVPMMDSEGVELFKLFSIHVDLCLLSSL